MYNLKKIKTQLTYLLLITRISQILSSVIDVAASEYDSTI